MKSKILMAVILLFGLTAIAGAAKKGAIHFKAPEKLVDGKEYYFVKKDAVIREGPGGGAKEIGRAAAGSILLKLGENERGNWYNLQGTTEEDEVIEGWIYKRWIKAYTGKEEVEEVKAKKPSKKRKETYLPAPDSLDEDAEYYQVKKSAIMRDGPTSKNKKIGRAAEGSVLIKLEENEKGSWYKLQGITEDGDTLSGWIYKRWLKEYTPEEKSEEKPAEEKK